MADAAKWLGRWPSEGGAGGQAESCDDLKAVGLERPGENIDRTAGRRARKRRSG